MKRREVVVRLTERQARMLEVSLNTDSCSCESPRDSVSFGSAALRISDALEAQGFGRVMRREVHLLQVRGDGHG